MRRLSAVILALGLAGAAFAEMPTPDGRVVLTVGGDLEQGNAPGSKPGDVGFGGHMELDYSKGVAFDDAMLAALPQHSIDAALFGAETSAVYSGPLLADVLKQSGAEGRTAIPMALDGYSVEINWQDIKTYQPILATHADGKPLSIGKFGPAIVVYPVKTFEQNHDALKGTQVYSLFFIGIN